MTKMKFKLFRSTFLLPFGMLISLTTGELEFYQDAVPKMSDDLTFEQLARYLVRNHQQRRDLHANQRSRKDHDPDYSLYKRRNFEARDVPSLLDMLKKEKVNPLFFIEQIHRNDDLTPIRYIPSPDRYTEYDPFKKAIYEKELEDSLADYPRKFVKMHEGGDLQQSDPIRENYENMPEFTYAFGEPDLSESHPFAVGPNDPRYYQETPFSLFTQDDDNDNKKEHQSFQIVQEPKKVFSSLEAKMKQNPIPRDEIEEDLIDLPEPHRRSENNPLIVSVEKTHEDLYIAALTVCLTAAITFLFIVVGIAIYRLQKELRATEDIEYPAYGVTGPNRDISPSGDQRLAQSAQMYHFQHQKQQIIAMENRASANRDPGSVSEAESDEENEEGDYTVYECPGLASTGEMEVKNPLFHDDPTPATPATPAQANREEDQ